MVRIMRKRFELTHLPLISLECAVFISGRVFHSGFGILKPGAEKDNLLRTGRECTASESAVCALIAAGAV